MVGSTPASLSAEPPAAAGVLVVGRRKRSNSLAAEAWRRFRKHHLAVASLFVLMALVLVVALGPLFWKVPINDIDFGARLQGPSLAHPFGTDDLGQDLLA